MTSCENKPVPIQYETIVLACGPYSTMQEHDEFGTVKFTQGPRMTNRGVPVLDGKGKLLPMYDAVGLTPQAKYSVYAR